MIYCIGLGSNIEPERNFVASIQWLQTRFGGVRLSRVAITQPEGVISDHPFYNAAALIASDLPETELKASFNDYEIAMGRDRSDPLCSKKDRPIDLDILFTYSADLEPVTSRVLPTEDYVRPFVLDLCLPEDLDQDPLLSAQLKTVTINTLGEPIGSYPRAIGFNAPQPLKLG